MKINATINRKALDSRMKSLEYKQLAAKVDTQVKALAAGMMRTLMTNTKSDSSDKRWYTGHTSRMWRLSQLNVARYRVYNNVLTKEQRHAVVDLLNFGNAPRHGGYIYPSRSKFLFIPFSKRAQRKKVGAKIPKEWVRLRRKTFLRRIDYALARKVKPFKATKYVTNAADDAFDKLQQIVRGALS